MNNIGFVLQNNYFRFDELIDVFSAIFKTDKKELPDSPEIILPYLCTQDKECLWGVGSGKCGVKGEKIKIKGDLSYLPSLLNKIYLIEYSASFKAAKFTCVPGLAVSSA